MRLPLGYSERYGACLIRKVRDYGYKYHVYVSGVLRRQAGTIGKARDLARQYQLSIR